MEHWRTYLGAGGCDLICLDPSELEHSMLHHVGGCHVKHTDGDQDLEFGRVFLAAAFVEFGLIQSYSHSAYLYRLWRLVL